MGPLLNANPECYKDLVHLYVTMGPLLNTNPECYKG